MNNKNAKKLNSLSSEIKTDIPANEIAISAGIDILGKNLNSVCFLKIWNNHRAIRNNRNMSNKENGYPRS